MTWLCLTHTPADAPCAERLQGDLEALGYQVARPVMSASPSPAHFVRALERAILGAAATAVVWSRDAADSEWVERALLACRRLLKPLLLVRIDGAPVEGPLLPAALVDSAAPWADAAAALRPHLPDPGGAGPLAGVGALLAHEHIARRREGVEAAQRALERGEHVEPLLAMLEHVARKEATIPVREAAQAVLQARRPRPDSPEPSRFIFPARCPKGHISSFNQLELCTGKTRVLRSVPRAGVDLTEVYVRCGVCGEPMILRIDCEPFV